MQLCHGVNTPHFTNQIYVPKTEEIPAATERFSSLLDLVPSSNVKLVTLCRSNRDGFVPRHLQQDIERDILSSVRAKFNRSNLIYDRNIMTHLGQGLK